MRSHKRVVFSLLMSACLLVTLISGVGAYIEGGWPENCLEMNDMVEASPLGSGAVGIYQRAFGDQAEQACRNDHREDVRRSFSWAFTDVPSSSAVGTDRSNPARLGQPTLFQDEWEVTIVSARFTTRIESGSGLISTYFSSDPEEKYLEILLATKYVGSGSASFSAGSKVLHSSGTTYSGVTLLGLDGTYDGRELFTGGVAEGTEHYVVADHVQMNDLMILFGYGDERVFISLAR